MIFSISRARRPSLPARAGESAWPSPRGCPNAGPRSSSRGGSQTPWHKPPRRSKEPPDRPFPFLAIKATPRPSKRCSNALDRDQFTADVVIVNAATNPVYGPLLDTDLGAWQKIVEVNLTGTLLMAQQAARRMQAMKRGSIVFVASVAGLEPMPGLGAYSISKAGIIGMAKALAKELGSVNVRVNVLAPGLVETKFSAAIFQHRAAYDRIMTTIPLGRHGQPQDIVGAAVFLASDAAAYVTGQTLVVDGGGRV